MRFITLLPLLASVAHAAQLRGLATTQHDGFNDYYRALATILFNFPGKESCDREETKVVCTKKDLIVKLLGKEGTKSSKFMPIAQTLIVIEIKNDGTKRPPKEYSFKDMSVADILAKAFPDFNRSRSGGYLQALYDVLCEYGGEKCKLFKNSGKTFTTCTKSGNSATLVGTGQNADLFRLRMRSFEGAQKTKKSFNFTGRTSTREVLRQAFEWLHNQ